MESTETECYSPNTLDKKYNPIKCELPAVYSLKINDCKIIGGSNIILINGAAYYNHIVDYNVNYTDYALHDYKKEYNLGKNRLYKTSIPEIFVQKAISLCINYNDNYYHYIFECISKFQVLTKCKIAKEYAILIDSSARDIRQFADIIQIFNIDNRRIIYVEKLQRVKVNELYVFTPLNYIPANIRNTQIIKCSDTRFNFTNIKYIRDKILDIIETKDSDIQAKKIYISRKNCKRRIYNDEEIDSKLILIGFKSIKPETLSLREQVALFSNADVIVAASGAALTNIIFCKPKCKIFVLANQYLDLSIFSSIAGYLNLDMKYILADNTSSKELHSDFHINVQSLMENLNY